MITKKNSTLEVNFDYGNSAGTCAATGNYKVQNGQLKTIGINGQYTKDEKTYTFTADRDDQGKININGVPLTILVDVGAEVAKLVEDVEAEVTPNNE